MTVHLAADIQPGWRLYSMDQPSGGPIATAISLPPGQPFAFAGAISAAEPHAIFDPTSGIQVRLYTGHAEFALPIKTAFTAPAGSQTVSVEIRYQTCNDVLCLPPRTVRVRLIYQSRYGANDSRRPAGGARMRAGGSAVDGIPAGGRYCIRLITAGLRL